MDKLKFMKTFMLAAEEGSISLAARKLGISKAAASKQLIDLENTLNTQLLDRTMRQLKLTDTGKSFYEALPNVFSAIADAESTVLHNHCNPVGTLKIASHRYFGERFIINYMKEFTTLYPDLKLDIELGDRFPDIDKENIDILCGIGHEGPDHLVRKKVATTRHVLCATPEFITNYGMPKTPEDLKKLPYITHSFREPDNIIAFKNKQEIRQDCIIRLNDSQAMLKCAMQSLGFIKIYNYFVEDYFKTGKMIELLKDYRMPTRSLYIFYQPKKFLPNKIRVFIDFICEKINSDPAFSQT